MIFEVNLCSFGCVILSSLTLLNNNVFVFAVAKSNVNRVNDAAAEQDASASLSQWRHVRHDDDRTKILAMMDTDDTTDTDAVTSKHRLFDDRIVFDGPVEYGESTMTTVRPHEPIGPIKSNATMRNEFEVDGDYTFG